MNTKNNRQTNAISFLVSIPKLLVKRLKYQKLNL